MKFDKLEKELVKFEEWAKKSTSAVAKFVKDHKAMLVTLALLYLAYKFLFGTDEGEDY